MNNFTPQNCNFCLLKKRVYTSNLVIFHFFLDLNAIATVLVGIVYSVVSGLCKRFAIASKIIR